MRKARVVARVNMTELSDPPAHPAKQAPRGPPSLSGPGPLRDQDVLGASPSLSLRPLVRSGQASARPKQSSHRNTLARPPGNRASEVWFRRPACYRDLGVSVALVLVLQPSGDRYRPRSGS